MKKNKLSFILFISLGITCLTSCDTSSLAEDFQNSVIDALIPNFWAFLTQFLALIVLIVLVSIFAYKPLRNYLDKRSDYLDNEIKSANKNNALSKVKLEEAEQQIADSKKEAASIIDSAKEQANLEKKKILDEANDEALKMKAKSEEDIKESQKRAQKEVEDAIVSVALDASKHVLSREVNESDNKKIIDDFVATLDASKNEGVK
jgi:F-type H+-transporting ATPase subunit b